jgi:hypothetical protein
VTSPFDIIKNDTTVSKMYFTSPPELDISEIVIDLPSREEHAQLVGYEPTKICSDYDTYCSMYRERKIVEAQREHKCAVVLHQININQDDEKTIKSIENQPNFLRWLF